jgi:autotransporter-associated beta strand protein
MKTFAHLVPVFLEILESRIAPAVHTWTGAGTDALWSNAANWTGGSPAADGYGDVDLVFPTNAAQLVVQNDIVSLVVDSITFSAAGGTSANGYTINGNAFTINTSAAGQDPFGIDVAAGVADATNGITQTFNTNITLSAADANFRTVEAKSRLTFHGDIDLGGRTLTFDNLFAGTDVVGIAIDGDISNGNLVKTSNGIVQLTGNNSHTNTTVNGGNIYADSDTALGGNLGTVTINDPGRILLHNGVTIVKPLLNLNSNGLLGGLGADGNTTNTFRGSVVLMAGAGGVAMGAGSGVANANTRLVIDGVISGATSTLSLNGAGVIEFTQNNTYTGVTNHNGNFGFGALQIDAPGGLGASGAGNEAQFNRNGAGPTGSALWLNFNGTLAENVLFAGSGVGGLGAIRVLGDNDVTLSGNIVFIAGAPWTFGVDDADGSLTTTGVIDSQGANRALTKVGAGTLIIGGTTANTYLGGTIINGGLVSVQNTSASPLGGAAGVVTVNNASTLRVEAGATVPNAVQLNADSILAGSGRITAAVTSTGGTVSPGTTVGSLTLGAMIFNATSVFLADINGAAAGTQHDQLKVSGVVTLGSAALALAGGFAATPGTTITLIDNGGIDAVSGTFAGLAEGAQVAVGGQTFTISYIGGTGNDVVLTAVTPLSDFTLAENGRSATYTETDGDVVTVKITKGALTAGDFAFGFSGDNRQQLQRLLLDADDAGTKLTITARPTAAGGDGFANVGYINATGVALGAVSVDGDLGRIDADAVKSLTVRSLGGLGLTSQAAGGSLVSNFSGSLSKLTVKASIHGATLLGAASIGTVKINGSFLGGQLSAGADLGSVTVRGDIVGSDAAPVIISGFGKADAPSKGFDVAIKSLKVSGGVEFLRVLAGYDVTLKGLNADAAISSIFVGADWRASTVLAGVSAGADGDDGTDDDAKLTTPGVRDTAEIFSTIAKLTIKGQALGTIDVADSFGIVAEQIIKAKIGEATLKLDRGERDAVDAFAIGATSDFFVREVTV